MFSYDVLLHKLFRMREMDEYARIYFWTQAYTNEWSGCLSLSSYTEENWAGDRTQVLLKP